MRNLIISIALLTLIGCNSTPEATTAENPAETATNTPAGGSEAGIAPMTTTPVPNAPVSGSESLQGGGSGVGTAAKSRAKDVAAQASGSSLGSAGTEPE